MSSLIPSLTSDISINVQDKGATGDGVTDDTAAFNLALASIVSGQTVYVPYGTYVITSELVTPAFKDWGIVGADGEKPIIDISALGTDEAFVTITQRWVTIKNLIIQGNQTVGNHTYIPTGIKVGNGTAVSNVILEHIRVTWCAVGFEFDNAQDSKSLYAIEGFNNNTDFLFTGTLCTSLRFMSCQALESEYSVRQLTQLTNCTWDNCVFAARPYASGIKPMDFNEAYYQGSMRGCRFEVNSTNNPGQFWDNLYMLGADTIYVIQEFSITECYFSGSGADDHIHFANYIHNCVIENNLFNNTPDGVDIRLAAQNVKGIKLSNNKPLKTLNRELLFFNATNSTLVQEYVFTSSTSLGIAQDTYCATNTGAAAIVTLTLPLALVGMKYIIRRNNATYALRVDPTGNQIFEGEALGKYKSIDTDGGYLQAECLVAGTWRVTASLGTITTEA